MGSIPLTNKHQPSRERLCAWKWRLLLQERTKWENGPSRHPESCDKEIGWSIEPLAMESLEQSSEVATTRLVELVYSTDQP